MGRISSCNSDGRFPVAYPILFGALQNNSFETRHPFLNLSIPVVQCRFRHNNQVWSSNPLMEFKVSEKSNGLQCLAETLREYGEHGVALCSETTYHLIGQDTVDTIVV